MTRCVLLHQAVGRDASPDEQDTLAAVDAVAGALEANGFAVERIALGLDFRPFVARITLDPPAFVFNLVESLPGLRFSGPAALAAAALLEGSAIRFTGSRLAALALSTDKPAAKRALKRGGVPVPPGPDEGWAGPFIVKHATEHASFGLCPRSVRQRLPQELPPGCFVEAFLPGREFNLSVFEEQSGLRVLPPAELVFTESWPAGLPRVLDYAGKWLPDDPRFAATTRRFDGIDSELAAMLRRLALHAFTILGLTGYGRIDIRLDANGVPHVLDVNANPALAPDAGFAVAAQQAGLSYKTLIGEIAATALRGSPAAPSGAAAPERNVENTPDIALRTELRETDAAAIDRLVAESGFFTPSERAVAAELVHEALQHGDASGYRFLLAERPDGRLLGYTCFGPVPATESSWDLYWIVVDKRAQGQGVGRALLLETAAKAASEGGERLSAETSGRPLYAPTRAFYAAVGFSLHAVLADFYATGDAKQIWLRPLP